MLGVLVTTEDEMELPVDYTRLTPQERRFVRGEYVLRQEGKCSHCGQSLTEAAADNVMGKPINTRLFPPNFFKWPVHLHHCHNTGMTIGAVHCHCNAVLWQYYGE